MPSVDWWATSTPTPPRALRRSTPAEASRRPWLPAAMRPRPCTPSPPAARRVNTWITPPIASAPYSDERGPRTISMRSICASGMSCSEVRPEVDEPTRMPSMRNRVWSDSVPRRNRVLSLPMPPWLTIVMPARPRSNSGSDRALLASSCSRSMTSTAASAASTVIAVRVAVTTRLSRSLASRSCAKARAGTDSAGIEQASASAAVRKRVLRDCMTVLRRARPRAQQGRAVATRRKTDGRMKKRMRDVAQCPPHRNLTAPGPVSGLAGGTQRRSRPRSRLAPSHACIESMRAQWRMPGLSRLPLRGQRRAGCAGRVVTGFPFQSFGEKPSDHPEARAVYAAHWDKRKGNLGTNRRLRGLFGDVRAAAIIIEQAERGHAGVFVLGGGDRPGGRATTRRRQQRDGGLGSLHQLGTARFRHFLPMAVLQRPFQRIQQVEAGLEAGPADFHEGIDGTDRGHVFQRTQPDLAQPGSGFRADIAQLGG